MSFVSRGDGTGYFEEELPAFYVDQLTFDTTATGVLFVNQVPAPGSHIYAGDGSVPVVFDLYDIAGGNFTGSPVATLEMYFNGAHVYSLNGGLIANPFLNEIDVDNSIPASGQLLHVVLRPSFPFTSEELITVRVVGNASGGSAFDLTYTFNVEDLTLPVVTAAQALSHKLVRVMFSKNVAEASVADVGDALNPANYALTALDPPDSPAVTPTVLSVSAATASGVDLLLDQELTQGSRYRVTVNNVVDLNENAVAAPNNTADFVGFVCFVPEGRSFDLYRMMPTNNRIEDQAGSRDLEKFLLAVQEVTNLVLCSVDAWTDILDPDIAPEDFVDAMLFDLGNPFSFDLSLEDKRRLVPVLLPIYKQKGTKPGAKNAIRFFLSFEIDIVAYNDESWELGVDELGVDTILGPSSSFAKYAFDVSVEQLLTDDQRARLRSIIEYMKPAHTHFVNLLEPETPDILDHVELGLSELGDEFVLH